MTNLSQQLEDKKKGCGKKFGARDERIQEPFICGTKQGEITIKCPQCRAEIAILEQAIAEIKNIQSQQTSKEIVSSELANADISNLLQKQRQDFERILNGIIGKLEDGRNQRQEIINYCKNKKQQLNQPKTKDESKNYK